MAIQYQIYFRVKGGSWVHEGDTYDTEFLVSDLTPAFDYFTVYEWRVDTYDDVTLLTTTGDTWTFITLLSRSFPHSRRSDYDPDLVWDEETETWVAFESIDISGGGLYQNQLVAVGMDSVGNGKIYFGGI